MSPRYGKRFGGHVYRADFGTELGQAFTQQSTTATDIKNAFAAQICGAAYLGQTCRIDIVQGSKVRISVPPAICAFAKF